MARTSIATDNFNRASLGTSDWGQLNTSLGGDVQINTSTTIKGQYSLQAVHQACVARWIGAGTFTADQYSKVAINTIAQPSNNSGIGVICRASADTGANKDFYELYIDGGTIGGNVYLTSLAKWVNGTRTVLYSNNETWVATDTVELECEGTTIRGMRNGSSLGSSWIVTDSSISTGSPGVTVAGTGIFLGDDWEGGSIGTAALTLTPSLFTNSSVFYGPTVAPGVVTLTPSLLSNTNTFFAPTVSWAQSLTPGLFSNSNAFYGPTVVRTPGFLTPVMKNNTRTVLANETGVTCIVSNPSTGALVLLKTGLTSDANGVVSVTDNAMVEGTTYAYDIILASGARSWPTAVA